MKDDFVRHSGSDGSALSTQRSALRGDRGFTLTELMIAMGVFTLIIGSVVTLLVKSQTIFRREQGVSEMDQNARLLIDFLTRDIQQSTENALGIGARFRSIYSNNGPEGKTDEMTIVSSDTETKIPAAALPFIPASGRPFSTANRYIEVLPNGAGHMEAAQVIGTVRPDEEFIVSAALRDGTVQFDTIKITGARLNLTGTIGITFEPSEHRGVQAEVPFGSIYENGEFTMRPVTIKRYFVDRKSDKQHPSFALEVNGGEPIQIARNVEAFQLRYLELAEGEVEGEWVKAQNFSRHYKTLAVEVTMTARTEIKDDPQAERLVTLASVVRPRQIPEGSFGSAGGGSNPGLPGDGGVGGGPGGGGGSGGNDPGGSGWNGPQGGDGPGLGGDTGLEGGPYRYNSRRIGEAPKLGRRLNRR